MTVDFTQGGYQAILIYKGESRVVKKAAGEAKNTHAEALVSLFRITAATLSEKLAYEEVTYRNVPNEHGIEDVLDLEGTR